MHNFLLEDMVDELIDAGIVIPQLKVQAIITLREKVWTNRFAVTWDVEDIETAAAELEIELIGHEAQHVLCYLHRNYSSCHGITNDTIEAAIDEIVARRNTSDTPDMWSETDSEPTDEEPISIVDPDPLDMDGIIE